MSLEEEMRKVEVMAVGKTWKAKFGHAHGFRYIIFSAEETIISASLVPHLNGPPPPQKKGGGRGGGRMRIALEWFSRGGEGGGRGGWSSMESRFLGLTDFFLAIYPSCPFCERLAGLPCS